MNIKICLSLSLLIISGCSSVPEKQHNWLDPSTVNLMIFRYQQPAQFSDSSLSEQTIANQVTNNLAEWGYNISTDDADNIDYEVSVNVGEITLDTTPAGFSFSIGNSDPRALDFQKANVLPITCFLSPKNQPEKTAELTMEVLASDYINNAEEPAKLTEFLVDDLSTVCFNLLSNLKIKTLNHEVSEKAIATPSWAPEIRVEVEEESVVDETVEINKDDTTSSPVKEIKATDERKNIEKSPAKEKVVGKKEPRKRVIIYNQGSPVIFKFGHERK